MASSKQHTVPESRNETPGAVGSPEPTAKSACEHFHEYGRERPGQVALWCFGIGFVTRLETQAVVSRPVWRGSSHGFTPSTTARL